MAASDSAARERLASYLVHAPFSLARLRYDRYAGVVTCPAEQFPLISSPSAAIMPLPGK